MEDKKNDTIIANGEPQRIEQEGTIEGTRLGMAVLRAMNAHGDKLLEFVNGLSPIDVINLASYMLANTYYQFPQLKNAIIAGALGANEVVPKIFAIMKDQPKPEVGPDEIIYDWYVPENAEFLGVVTDNKSDKIN